ncbi:protein-export chaperone SecB [Micromonospora sp. PLK6-60]|uniref:protein-export chaperone SecB n=1 Tax=Micromonospora sp. PLK6-60 TaxID=2873383 RepID=UPI0035ABE8B1
MVRLGDSAAVYHVTYQLQALSADGKSVAFRAALTMSAVFDFSDPSLTDEELQKFGMGGVLDLVHPYVREQVHSLTARMGLPPLLLDVKAPSP